MNRARYLFPLALLCSLTTAFGDERLVFFEERIRPLLSDHCYDCHSGDDSSAKLRLDTRAGWVRGGERGPAIVPGDPTASLLFQAVTSTDPDRRMPPSDVGDPLTDRELKDLSDWIRHGAVDPRTDTPIHRDIDLAATEHWALQPLVEPAFKTSEHPIDELIGRNLSDRTWQATPPASIEVLIRRATYDLHGLPPSQTQLALTREDFPNLVRELLDSPRYGERWARHWLDVARYSDAKDGVLMYGDARIRPFAYTYRDYVIRSFNQDKPFDDFIREQLAADQLGLERQAPELAAMGLLTLGRMFDNNPHDVIDDQIDVVTRGFLGLTVSCARCHDHKFDPISTADYYSLYGVFASSIEPLDRPRIETVTEGGEAFEDEFGAKLKEVFSLRERHYEETLAEARARTPDYLVQVATTEPDVAETAIFFLSLIPDQLRPLITHRWRRLVARRAFPDDPIFGPWHDLMQDPTNFDVDRWQSVGVDPRLTTALVSAQPSSPAEVAQVYGEVIRNAATRPAHIRAQLVQLESERELAMGGAIELTDIVAGGEGIGTGKAGQGLHPGTGQSSTGETGFIAIAKHDQWIDVPSTPLIDGVFVPKGSSAVVSSTGLKIDGLRESSGQTWDYFKRGPSSGFITTVVDEIDFNAPPHSMLAMHANKGITFDLAAFRRHFDFETSRLQLTLANVGARGQSQLDFAIYLDGELVQQQLDVAAQSAGIRIDIELPESRRFLTLVVTEGAQGISHDQAILGDPRIVPAQRPALTEEQRQKLQSIDQRIASLKSELESLGAPQHDPLGRLLHGTGSPIWFPIHEVDGYLSRQPKDQFRGIVNQLDGIAVRHAGAAGRAMILVDSERLTDSVIFQRGDPRQPGNRVPRQFLTVLSSADAKPFSKGSGRLELAEAIASDRNPLTARVWANRVWMHHFGQSLVEDPSDFGLRTEQPLQHELLDFLALSLIKNDWRTKPLHELIMTSKAYQRSSILDAKTVDWSQQELDPDNHYYWRGNRRRLDMEQMRDTLLATSGDFDTTMFGRPRDINDLTNRRRTIYAFVERQSLPNIVQVFDVANADSSSSRRLETTVPQQALFAMNSALVADTTERLVKRLETVEPESRIKQLYLRVLAREPSPDELELAQTFVKSNSLESLGQVLLMTNEWMFID